MLLVLLGDLFLAAPSSAARLMMCSSMSVMFET